MSGPPGRARTALVVAGFVVFGLAAEVLAASRWIGVLGPHAFDALVDLVAGWALAGAGLMAWRAAPRSREGPLLLLAAVGWFVGTLTAPTTPLERSALGWLLGFLWQLHAGFLVHAIATWPTGRIERPTQLVLAVGGYIAALYPQLWTTTPVYVLLGALLAGGLLLDRRTVPRSRRHALRPGLDAGLLLALAVALLPGLTRTLGGLGLELLATATNLYALTVATVGVMLAHGLARQSLRGMTADVAVELDAAGAGSVEEVERGLLELLTLHPSTSDEVRNAAEQATALAARNRGLRASLHGQVSAVDASRRRLVEVADDERRELLERLRAGAGARLDRLSLTVHTLADRPGEPAVVDRLVRAAALLDRARAELDAIAGGLDPGGVAERGLASALRDLVAASPVPAELRLQAGEPRASTLASTLYFVAAEALANVARHAGASRAWLLLEDDGGSWQLTVEDDGVGGADPTRGTGLRGLAERTEAIGGRLTCGPRPTGGTRLRATLPMTQGPA